MVAISMLSAVSSAQSTIATGDARTVAEPVYPPVCSQVQATKFIVQTNAVNIDPYNATCGSTGGTNGTLGCTGGTDYEPSSSSSSYAAAETADNTAVQAALNACASGHAVELVPGSSGQMAFVLSPWSIPTGVGIIIDAGIHVYASRNLTDYGGTNCGIVTTGSSSCNPWITSPSATGSGIYGMGVLDGRGWDAYIGQTTESFYQGRIQAYCNLHSGAVHGSPACTPNASGNNSYGPDLLYLSGDTNFTIYKTTLKDSGDFFINWIGGNGFTAWDAKLIAPFEVSNTDGWDPVNSTDGTFIHGFVSNGDNVMAIKASSAASSNISFLDNQTGAGIGVAIGSTTQYGVSNVLVDTLVQDGNLYNDNSAGLQIASDSADGGAVNRVTFQNVCMVNEQNSIRLFTNYGGKTGTSYPSFQNILLRNINVLGSTAPYTTGNSGYYTFQGLNATYPLGVQLDNVAIQGVNQGVASQSGVTLDQYTNAYLGTGQVPASITSQFSAGTSNTTSGTAGASTAYPCTTSTWQPLIGDFNVKDSTANNTSVSLPISAGPFTLQATLRPATEIDVKESPAPTGQVEFLDNGVQIGSVSLSGDGSYASFAVSPAAGNHFYQAYYPGDAHYPALTFGGVGVSGGTAPASILIAGTLR